MRGGIRITVLVVRASPFTLVTGKTLFPNKGVDNTNPTQVVRKNVKTIQNPLRGIASRKCEVRGFPLLHYQHHLFMHDN